MRNLREQDGKIRSAFTLVELLVVIAIIGILVALLLPAVQAAREAARRIQCTNQEKQLALAVHEYHDTRKQFPAARIENHHATWLFLILPHMEQQAVYDLWPIEKDYYDMPDSFHAMTVPGIMCPSQGHESPLMSKGPDNVHGHGRDDERQGAVTDYTPVVGSTCLGLHYNNDSDTPGLDDLEGTMVYGDYPEYPSFPRTLTTWKSRTKMAKITDGTSQTILFGENSKFTSVNRHGFCGDHGAGFLLGYSQQFVLDGDESYGFGSSHPGVVLFAMVDGSVQPLRKDIDGHVLDRMATRAGDDPYEIDGTATSCRQTSGGTR